MVEPMFRACITGSAAPRKLGRLSRTPKGIAGDDGEAAGDRRELHVLDGQVGDVVPAPQDRVEEAEALSDEKRGRDRRDDDDRAGRQGDPLQPGELEGRSRRGPDHACASSAGSTPA